ncbi:MAG: phosphoribosyltransferase family protein [Candidatus Paceibacterota bacterium]|jgi:ComF family protein
MKKLKEVLDKVLSLILPKEKFVEKIEKMDIDEANNLPGANEIKDEQFKAVFQYKNKTVRQAIWEIKYRGNREILKKFTKILYEFMLEEISDKMAFENFRNPLLIPIPVSRNSLRERGFNQCELIVRELAQIDNGINFEIETKALKKIRETPHQSKLKNRALRLKNLKGCFSADTDKVKNRCVIIIDDVITTSTTMNEVSKTLRKAGARKVIGFAIAH